MNEYRHVCLKDLDNYFKIDDYLGGLSSEEYKRIKSNLGINVISGSYNEIKKLLDDNKLNLFCKYIITDFQTIYLSNAGEIWGLDVNPSKVCKIFLTPVSESMFSPCVYIIDEDNNFFEGEYDIQSESLESNITTKGKILYLKDVNGNSAYYDFKNIKFRILLSPELDSRLSESISIDVFTFNSTTDVPGVYLESSNQIYDNQLGRGCLNNVFLDKCSNIVLHPNSSNNLFIDQLSCAEGLLYNSVVQGLVSENVLSVQFLTIPSHDQSIAIKSYLSGNHIMSDVVTLDQNVYLYV